MKTRVAQNLHPRIYIYIYILQRWSPQGRPGHFEVLGLKAQVLGLEAYKFSKMSCPRLENTIIF